MMASVPFTRWPTAVPAVQRLDDLLEPVVPAVQEYQLDVAAVVAARQQVVDLVIHDSGIDKHPLATSVGLPSGFAWQGDP